jgi:hypothetical protein
MGNRNTTAAARPDFALQYKDRQPVGNGCGPEFGPVCEVRAQLVIKLSSGTLDLVQAVALEVWVWPTRRKPRQGLKPTAYRVAFCERECARSTRATSIRSYRSVHVSYYYLVQLIQGQLVQHGQAHLPLREPHPRHYARAKSVLDNSYLRQPDVLRRRSAIRYKAKGIDGSSEKCRPIVSSRARPSPLSSDASAPPAKQRRRASERRAIHPEARLRPVSSGHHKRRGSRFGPVITLRGYTAGGRVHNRQHAGIRVENWRRPPIILSA